MTIAFGPDGIIVTDPDKPVAHTWDDFVTHCTRCGMPYKYFEETRTPCVTVDIMPE